MASTDCVQSSRPRSRRTRTRVTCVEVRRSPAALSPREGLRASGFPDGALDDERASALRSGNHEADLDSSPRQHPHSCCRAGRRDSMRMLNDGNGKPKNGFMWTFVALDDDGEMDIAILFAADR